MKLSQIGHPLCEVMLRRMQSSWVGWGFRFLWPDSVNRVYNDMRTLVVNAETLHLLTNLTRNLAVGEISQKMKRKGRVWGKIPKLMTKVLRFRIPLCLGNILISHANLFTWITWMQKRSGMFYSFSHHFRNPSRLGFGNGYGSRNRSKKRNWKKERGKKRITRTAEEKENKSL